ncbi:MAG TPA: MFS transporter [Bacteroidia bacterium]|nr:MFS transporter [Bacteroidia bacterium]
MKLPSFSRVVLLLSLVSLLTDISSEMLYPVMPLYLQSIGFSALWIGFLEGAAQVVIGFSTGYFGKLSDQIGTRLPFVRVGYFLSACSKPMMILWNATGWVFFSRIAERLGKGIRTSARDALLADASHENERGRVFGFHRAMDTLGAAIGPLIALAYLTLHPGEYSFLFLLAFIPGIIGATATLFIRQKRTTRRTGERTGFLSFIRYWKIATPAYRKIVLGLLFFALLNSSDSFLFLISHDAGISDRDLILAYVFYNFIFALTAYPAGILADKLGMRNTVMLGLTFFVIAYTGFSQLTSSGMLFLMFGCYGFFGALTEGITKAWLSTQCESGDRGTALGFYKSLSSLLSLPSSLLAGYLWMSISPSFSILYSAIGTCFVILYFLLFIPGAHRRSPTL